MLWDREDAARWRCGSPQSSRTRRGADCSRARGARSRRAIADAGRWGGYWSIGSAIAGALWGTAAVVMFPASPPHQALLIVCLFGVVLGGLNLTAVYKPSFYGFVLRGARAAHRARRARGRPGASLHGLVLLRRAGLRAVVRTTAQRVLTHSLAMRYENVDLIGELKAQSRAAESARAAAETANRARASSSPPRAMTCASRCTRWDCSPRRWRRARAIPR